MPEIDRANLGEATTIPPEKHEKRQKSARLDFLGAKGAVHLSSDYYIIDGDQAPTSNKGGLSACSELAEPTLKSAKLTPACSMSAKPTTFATSFKSARSTFQLAGRLPLPPALSWLGRLSSRPNRLSLLVPKWA
jgi:hypothetical protein